MVRFVNSDQTGTPLLVEGEAGSGKSALLAKFVDHYTAAHPHAKVGVSCFSYSL